ncbi:type VII secretion protein EssB [Bacillus carboniphilus]|uniref:Type VII secretion protein EssB n=1 Tax=Bacillus carboniphilus TaxID=86663 RepID=A0ABY9JTV1_9BACI|nr:type VII secretion protein EssB [Bacillus carboniphilus]WLR42821.1 type VII secretion protein EssB [Bacillus carboniphilus]
MSEKNGSYLQEKLEAVVRKEDKNIVFTFQKEKLKLDEVSEISFLKGINSDIQKEIKMEEDELVMIYTMPDSFSVQLKANEKERLLCAYQLIQKVKSHTLKRLHLVVCPENIVFSQGLTPYFLHFGVMESLPPYETDEALLLKETKATVAAIIDQQYTFDQYFSYHETLKLSTKTKSIMKATSMDQMEDLVTKYIKEEKQRESQFLSVSKKKWKTNRYILLGISICLIPALIYSIFSLIFINPKHDRVVAAQENFLLDKYSDVVTEIQSYDVDDIPTVTQYQLALSYIMNESLTESQRDNVLNTISLQSDPRYYHYWIYIGRGQAEEALEEARFLEDRDLILFGLLKYSEQVKSDDSLESEERQQELDSIEREIEEYEEEMKALEEEKKAEEESQSQDSQGQDQSEQQPATTESSENQDNKESETSEEDQVEEKEKQEDKQTTDTDE